MKEHKDGWTLADEEQISCPIEGSGLCKLLLKVLQQACSPAPSSPAVRHWRSSAKRSSAPLTSWRSHARNSGQQA
jgi:hypothetical protein